MQRDIKWWFHQQMLGIAWCDRRTASKMWAWHARDCAATASWNPLWGWCECLNCMSNGRLHMLPRAKDKISTGAAHSHSSYLGQHSDTAAHHYVKFFDTNQNMLWNQIKPYFVEHLANYRLLMYYVYWRQKPTTFDTWPELNDWEDKSEQKICPASLRKRLESNGPKCDTTKAIILSTFLGHNKDLSYGF